MDAAPASRPPRANRRSLVVMSFVAALCVEPLLGSVVGSAVTGGGPVPSIGFAGDVFVIYVLALLAHEVAHVVVARMLGGHVTGWHLDGQSVGPRIAIGRWFDPFNNLGLSVAAGPMASLAVAVVALVGGSHGAHGQPDHAVLTAAGVVLFNTLTQVTPWLGDGRTLRCLGRGHDRRTLETRAAQHAGLDARAWVTTVELIIAADQRDPRAFNIARRCAAAVPDQVSLIRYMAATAITMGRVTPLDDEVVAAAIRAAWLRLEYVPDPSVEYVIRFVTETRKGDPDENTIAGMAVATAVLMSEPGRRLDALRRIAVVAHTSASRREDA